MGSLKTVGIRVPLVATDSTPRYMGLHIGSNFVPNLDFETGIDYSFLVKNQTRGESCVVVSPQTLIPVFWLTWE